MLQHKRKHTYKLNIQIEQQMFFGTMVQQDYNNNNKINR
jgi:hypothetical protein